MINNSIYYLYIKTWNLLNFTCVYPSPYNWKRNSDSVNYLFFCQEPNSKPRFYLFLCSCSGSREVQARRGAQRCFLQLSVPLLKFIPSGDGISGQGLIRSLQQTGAAATLSSLAWRPELQPKQTRITPDGLQCWRRRLLLSGAICGESRVPHREQCSPLVEATFSHQITTSLRGPKSLSFLTFRVITSYQTWFSITSLSNSFAKASFRATLWNNSNATLKIIFLKNTPAKLLGEVNTAQFVSASKGNLSLCLLHCRK